jgi:hypothetical protein
MDYNQWKTMASKPNMDAENRLHELENLQEYRIKAQRKVMEAQWNKFIWLQQHHYEKTFRFGNYVLWFPKEANEKVGKFRRHYCTH